MVVVSAVPTDRDIPAVYALIAEIADRWVMTATPRNITITFPDEATALASARQALEQAGRTDVSLAYRPTIAEAIPLAQEWAGADGTVLMPVAQPAIGDAMEYFGRTFEQV